MNGRQQSKKKSRTSRVLILCATQSLESLDNGKPFVQALSVDIDGTASFTRYFAGAADKIVGQTIPAGMLVSLFMFAFQLLVLI